MKYKIYSILTSNIQDEYFYVGDKDDKVHSFRYSDASNLSSFVPVTEVDSYRAVTLYNNSDLIAADYYVGIARYSINGELIWFNKKVKKVTSLKVFGEKNLLFAAQMNSVIRLDPNTGSVIEVYKNFNDVYNSNYNDNLLFVRNQKLKLLDTNTNKFTFDFKLKASGAILDALIISNLLIISQNDTTVSCYEISTGIIKWTINVTIGSNLQGLGFLPNENCLVALKQFRLENNKKLFLVHFNYISGDVIFEKHLGDDPRPVFYNNSKVILTLYGRAFDSKTGNLIKVFPFSF